MTRLRVAIPGSPTDWRPLPPDAYAAAAAAVDALARAIRAQRPFGFLDPPPLAPSLWQDTLSVLAQSGLDEPARCVVTEWRWGVLWDCGDWYEVGWHPCNAAYWGAAYGPRLWDALNPGKRVPYRLRRP